LAEHALVLRLLFDVLAAVDEAMGCILISDPGKGDIQLSMGDVFFPSVTK